MTIGIVGLGLFISKHRPRSWRTDLGGEQCHGQYLFFRPAGRRGCLARWEGEDSGAGERRLRYRPFRLLALPAPKTDIRFGRFQHFQCPQN
jgi:hypothetical protein